MEITPPTDVSLGYVESIYERKNELIRPAVANVDMLLIVLSAKKPKPDFLLADKLSVYAQYNLINYAVVINKCDAAAGEDIKEQYKGLNVPILCVSAKMQHGTDKLRELIKNKCVCFAGQSAVGKSSLINALNSSFELETGGLSKKTDRGRHTTRHSELMFIPDINATVIDTPGFSVLECIDIEPPELSDYYPEFKRSGCRFLQCLHDREPGCAVKEQLIKGEISKERYDRYLILLNQLRQRKETMYD